MRRWARLAALAFLVPLLSCHPQIGPDTSDTGPRDTGPDRVLSWEKFGGVTPGLRMEHAQVYDATRATTVVFGGGGTNSFLGDTWEFDGQTWRSLSPGMVPDPLMYPAMAWHEARGEAVLFGGMDDDWYLRDETWEFNGARWTRRFPEASPSVRQDHVLVYDSNRQVVILFGGATEGTSDDDSNYRDDTWEYDGSTWTQSPARGPTARIGAMAAFDPVRNVMVLYGGVDGLAHHLEDTWEYDGLEWVEKDPTPNPGKRWCGSMAWDGDLEAVVLFGGEDTFGRLGETWTWDGTAWTDISPASSPSDRAATAMSWDSARGSLMLYGGYDQGWNVLDEMWELAWRTE